MFNKYKERIATRVSPKWVNYNVKIPYNYAQTIAARVATAE